MSLFDIAAQKLEQHTGFSELEARGTLRIAVKAAGLDPNNINLAEIRVVFDQLMPVELEQRGVGDVAAACAAVMADLENSPIAASDPSSSSPEDVFRRLSKA